MSKDGMSKDTCYARNTESGCEQSCLAATGRHGGLMVSALLPAQLFPPSINVCWQIVGETYSNKLGGGGGGGEGEWKYS